MALSPADLRRYARHLSLKEVGTAGQEKLRAARILIAGCGGLGSPAALYLAAAGIGTLGLLDFDRVDESNLQRQVLFDSAHIGEPKAQRARQRLMAINPSLQITAYEQELCAANVRDLFDRYDLIIDGTDRIDTHYLVNDACVLYGKALVTAAIYRFEGQIMSYRPGPGPCYRCLFPSIDPAAAPPCADTGVLGVLPGVLGTLQATEAVKLVTGIGSPLIGRLLTYDALEMHFQELRFTRRADCAVCGTHPSITAPFDPPGFCTQHELQSVPTIDAPALAQRLRQDTGTLLLIDVREPPEFDAGHLPGSHNLTLDQIQAGALTMGRADHGRELVFVCRSGVRSARGAAMARRAGAVNVSQLEGGLLRWRQLVDPGLDVI